MLGAELVLRGHRVALIDRDRGQHLSRVFDFYPPDVNGLALGEDPSAAIRIVDTAPELNPERALGYLREADWALVPVKGPEAGSVLALPILMEWLEQVNGARLLGFLPTMYKARRGDSRQCLGEFERLADKVGARVFAPIADHAGLASFRLEGHPYAPLAEAVEEVQQSADLLRSCNRGCEVVSCCPGPADPFAADRVDSAQSAEPSTACQRHS